MQYDGQVPVLTAFSGQVGQQTLPAHDCSFWKVRFQPKAAETLQYADIGVLSSSCSHAAQKPGFHFVQMAAKGGWNGM